MRRRAPFDAGPGRRWALTAALLALLSTPARAARADASDTAALAIVGVVLPSDTGVLVGGGAPRFVLGWSLQIPIERDHVNRMVFGLDWVPTQGALDLSGRFGYRFAPGEHRLFGGLGVTIDRTGPTWSPEIGVNFLGNGNDFYGFEFGPFMHLLLRAEIAPGLDQIRGGSLLVGWTFL